jgi:DNA-directed RNA polymerase sigma subunit (sigma70/sigma32)
VNDQSLERVNAFLAAVAQRVQPGEVLQETPAEIGRELAFPDALSAARAVRALIARRRLEPAQGSYRLIDANPVGSAERESIERARRRRKPGRAVGRTAEPADGRPTYSAVGREMVERLIEMGREVGTLRANLKAAREEARVAREAREDAERRAQSLGARVHDLESRAEMAEANLRNVLAAAKVREHRDAPVGDSEMEAILGVLKGGEAAVE